MAPRVKRDHGCTHEVVKIIYPGVWFSAGAVNTQGSRRTSFRIDGCPIIGIRQPGWPRPGLDCPIWHSAQVDSGGFGNDDLVVDPVKTKGLANIPGSVGNPIG